MCGPDLFFMISLINFMFEPENTENAENIWHFKCWKDAKDDLFCGRCPMISIFLTFSD